MNSLLLKQHDEFPDCGVIDQALTCDQGEGFLSEGAQLEYSQIKVDNKAGDVPRPTSNSGTNMSVLQASDMHIYTSGVFLQIMTHVTHVQISELGTNLTTH